MHSPVLTKLRHIAEEQADKFESDGFTVLFAMLKNAIFLQAERQPDGARTFKLIEGEPLETSYGEDLYNRTFGTDGNIHRGRGSSPS